MLRLPCRPRALVPPCLVALVLVLGCSLPAQFVNCTDSSECPAGEICDAGTCQSPCGSDSDCGTGGRCDAGVCAQSCVGDGDCTTGVCEGGFCTPACTSDGDCSSGDVCGSNGHCNPPCAGDADCGSNGHCSGGHCVGCSNDGDCPSGQTCMVGVCTCSSGDDCTDPLGCVNGVCGMCDQDSQCATGTVCVDARCVAPCTADPDCSPNVCVGGHCVACRNDGDCSPPSVCTSGSCTAPSCIAEADCPLAYFCSDGSCISGCDSTARCPNGEVCANGTCGAPCQHQSECPGQSCYGGLCVNPCTPDAACGQTSNPCTVESDCAVGYSCLSHQCVAGFCLNPSTCAPACHVQADCPPNFVCGGGFCQCASGCSVPLSLHRPAAVSWVKRFVLFVQSMFGYGPPPSFTFDLSDATPGASPSQQLTFDTTAGKLETFQVVLTYPPDFGFNGFTALGPANTQVGSYALDTDLDDVPEVVLPIRATDFDHAYADQALKGVPVPLDATVAHGGAHTFTIELPRGGDADLSSLVAAMPVRIVVTLFAGILSNPPVPGPYQASAAFTSIDPTSDGPDDATGEGSQGFSVDVTVVVGTVTTTTATTTTSTTVPDHFLCYKTAATKGTPPFAGATGVTLVDQFESTSVDVKKGAGLCAPASKSGEDPGAPQHPAHLRDYQLKAPKGAPKFVALRGRTVTNQFGVVVLDVVKRATLLVPTAKSRAASPAPLSPPTPDHFTCYKVAVTRGTAPFAPILGVRVDDQFGTLTLDLKKPSRLCAPTDKRGENPGAETHPDHLLCYQAKLRKEAPKFSRVSPVYVHDQFGTETLDVVKPLELCVPSLKNAPAPARRAR
jgi:hypothetical protein